MSEHEATRPSSGPAPDAKDGSGLPRPFGEFVLLRLLGRGGMGVVFEAEQPALGRKVALKVLTPETLGDARDRERFAREARAAARLHHTNIVPVFGVGEAEGRQWLAMQLIEGRSAKDLVRELRLRGDETPGDGSGRDIAGALLAGRHGASLVPGLSPTADGSAGSAVGSRTGARYHRSVARLGAQVADALAHAHGRGVLHRDVKPSNVLVDEEERAWLTDFGVAKAEGEAELTRAGDLVGTVRYMAPECFRGRFDARSDVFGLGLTLHELLALEPARLESDETELLQAVMHRPVPGLRSIDPSIPRDLETIVAKACEREPADRYSSADELAADLRAFLEGRPIRARRASPVERAWRWARRNPLVASLGTAVLVLSAVIAVRAQLDASRLEAKNREVTRGLARAEAAELSAQEQLHRSSLVQARALRLSDEAGRREASLQALAVARSLVEPLGLGDAALDELRDRALDSLVLADLERRSEPAPFEPGAAGSWDPAGEHGAFVQDGELIVESPSRGGVVHRLPGVGGTDAHSYSSWDATGRWLAVRAGPELGRRLLVVDTRDWSLSPWTPAGYADDAHFSADGRRLAIQVGRSDVELREASSGELLGCLSPSSRRARVRLSPDGALLACLPRGEDAVQLWDVDAGLQVGERLLESEPETQVTALAWSPRGRRLAAASGSEILVWDLASPEPPQRLVGHASSVTSLEFDGSGEFLVSSAWDSTTRAWRVERAVQVARLEGRRLVGALDGGFALLDLQSGRMEAWQVSRSPIRRSASGRGQGLPVPIGYLSGGELHLLGSRSGRVQLRDARSGRVIDELFRPGLRAGATDGAGTAWLATVDGRLETLRDWLPSSTAALPEPARALAFAKGRLALLLADGRAGVRDTDGGLQLLAGHREGPWSIALSPDGELLATGGWNATQVLLQPVQGGPARVVPGSDGENRAFVSWAPDGGLLAIGYESRVDLFDAQAWSLVASWPRRQGESLPARVALHPAGRVAAFAWSSHELHLVTVPEGRKLARLPVSESELLSHLEFSPDGHRLASGDESGALHLWDLDAIATELEARGLGWGERFW